jgi:branched-chain amino acid aminotransferase
MLKLYALTPELHEISLPGMSSLDAVSRQLPDGLYSTFRTYAGRERVLDLEHHLRRLYDPLAALGVEPGLSAPELRAALRLLLKDFAPGEARVRISLSMAGSPGQVFVMLEPLKLLDETVYQRGVRVVTSRAKRQSPRLKTTAFIGQSEQERESILREGIFEGLMVRNGRLLEGLTSNFCAVKAGKILTARQGILLGVTRRVVLRVARSNGFSLEYRPLRVEELPEIDEAFITSSSRGVVPIVEIDRQPVGLGQVGSVARALRLGYDAYVLKKAEKI